MGVQESNKAAEPRTSSILLRTPSIPPLAVAANRLHIELEDGRKLLDATGGGAVSCIGGGHPTICQTLKDQVDRLCCKYSRFTNQPAEELAKLLTESSSGAFEVCGLFSGGSEAMEGVVKLACQYFQEIGQPQRSNFIARELSCHGNTLSTLSLAYHPRHRGPFVTLLDYAHFHHISPAYAKRFQRADESEEQYVERLRAELEAKFIALGPDTVIGFVAETVVGATTGVVPAPKGYFKAMHSVCQKYGALFILDEVMSGMGRMGTLHAWQSFGDGVAPDLQAVAKGLGGGYAAIGAANPLSCAAALAVQKVIIAENLLENCRVQSAYLEKLLKARLQGPNAPSAPFTFDIRGGGLFWGIEFDFDCAQAAVLDFRGQQFAMLVQAHAQASGLVIMAITGGANLQGTKGDVILLAPAYNVTAEEVEKIVGMFGNSVDAVLKAHQV
ncbi:pyridoxal phosphate-dependent transferase [Mycena rebaudengoi]|nr:pyridoxal phosphate-dependent transferase [Mycena rebaudengoi]